MMYNNLFASAADAILSRYRSYLNDRPATQPTPEPTSQPQTETKPATEVSDESNSGGIDSRSPQTTQDATSTSTTKTPTVASDSNDDAVTAGDNDSYEPTETPAAPTDQPTYSFQRKAQMSYQLRLEFELSTLERVVSSLADGDEEAVEQFVAAGFGLSADFNVRGHQVTRTQMTGDDITQGQSRAVSRQRARFNRMGLMQYQDRSFGLQSFFKEAMSVRSKMKTYQVDGFSKTVNKFALRYRLDSSFSMAHLSRFTGQASQMADQKSADLGNYLNAAGAVAETGTNDMMATFFNAVDDYLAGAEQAMLEKAGMFFDQAASELGFEGEMTQFARDQIIGSVQSFFDRVESAVSSLAARYTVTAPPDQPAVEPATIEPKMVDPAVADETTELAAV